MTKHFCFFILITLHSIILPAQTSSTGFSLQARVGLTGDHINQSPTYESFETSHMSKQNRSWAIGGNYQFIGKNNMGWRVGALYEDGQFSRMEEYEYVTSQNDVRSGEITRDFSNQTIIAPIQFLWQLKRIGFSTGIIYNFHLREQVKNNLPILLVSRCKIRDRLFSFILSRSEFGTGC